MIPVAAINALNELQGFTGVQAVDEQADWSGARRCAAPRGLALVVLFPRVGHVDNNSVERTIGLIALNRKYATFCWA